MSLIADLHIHSKYSRATSPEMNIPTMAKWAKIKGIQLLGTGDFTHPGWLEELRTDLEPVGPGTFAHGGIKFLLTAEVSNIYHREGKLYKVHNILLAPDLLTVEKIIRQLTGYGKLASDGRPILIMDSQDLVKIVMDCSSECMVIPAHAWTPHFGVLGSVSGFNSLEECFGDQVKHIYAVETGLSSDPPMNWRLTQLDRITLISNSDAHSPQNLGREANVLSIPDGNDLYRQVTEIIKTKDKTRFLNTIEFFPEEGKYHFNGHRLCQYRAHPRETIPRQNICPVCGKPITVGVLHRVEALADRNDKMPESAIPYRNLIPLREIIAAVLDCGKSTKKVDKEYLRLINGLGTEFRVLMEASEAELREHSSAKIASGIMKMRAGEVEINPGYDGEFGSVKIKR